MEEAKQRREKKEEEEVKIEKIESLFLSIARELNIDFNPFGNVQRNKISKGLEKSAHKSQQLSIKIGVNC